MLQHNAAEGAERSARHAHIAHAAVVSLHALCCGAPIALLLVASLAATAAGGFIRETHAFLHGHELWLLAMSALLIAIGGYAEWRAWRGGLRRFPALFALSCACLIANIAIVGAHRL